MEKNKYLNKLVKVSIEVGNEIAYVQGGGGNTSVKLDNYRMAIKASGINLKDMTESSGFTVVDYSLLNEYLNSKHLDEDRFSKKISSYVVETKNRPSIETGFHSVLGKYVIHTHSAFVNILTCSEEGEEEVLNLFPNSYWVKYATPGRDLTIEVKDSIPDVLPKEGSVFLQNHGLIVWAASSKRAIQIHRDISDCIIKSFGLSDFLFNKSITYAPDRDQTRILFPDQAVYTMASEDILVSDGAQETIYTYEYILENIQKVGLSPLFLPIGEANKLLDMESEKYRQSLVKS